MDEEAELDHHCGVLEESVYWVVEVWTVWMMG